MGMDSLKYYIIVYVVFIGIVSALDIGIGVDLSVPEPPKFLGSAIFGQDLAETIAITKSADPVGFLLGLVAEFVLVIIAVVAFIISFIFFLLQLLVFWYLPGQPFINIILTLYRILLGIELLPYIKSNLHPLQGGHQA